ncbi:type I restriction enzyme, S subunit [Candidatus Methanomarinus sp.]|nr:type I restriction enzyme, S subunit [ANME-2 cluster archaeon]
MAWKTVEIGSFLKERRDRFKPEEANTLDLKRIEKIDFQGKIHVIDHKPTKTNMILVKKGDLVISGINVEKGALAVYEEDEDALATIHYSSYVYDENQVDIEYLKWFLKSRTFQDIVKKQAGGGIKTELKAKRFLPLKIQLPALNKQIDIANRINNVTAEINELNNINDQNEKLLIQLREKLGEEKLNNPSWKQVRLKEILISKLRNGYSPKSVEYPTNIKRLTLTATTSGRFKPQYFKYIDEEIPADSYLWLKPNDILIQRSNSIDYVGISAIYNGMPQKYIYPDLMIKIQCIDEVDVKFLHYTLLNKCVREYYRRKSKGTSNSMKKINQKVVENTLISLPSLTEQKRIVAKVDQLMHLCDELETQLNQSKKDSEILMQAVLHEAFS